MPVEFTNASPEIVEKVAAVFETEKGDLTFTEIVEKTGIIDYAEIRKALDVLFNAGKIECDNPLNGVILSNSFKAKQKQE